MDELAIPLVLVAATVGIGWLCWVWMRASRASQRRMEENDRRMIALMEEQNALLRELTRRGTDAN